MADINPMMLTANIGDEAEQPAGNANLEMGVFLPLIQHSHQPSFPEKRVETDPNLG